VEATDKDGATPLHWAARLGKDEMILLLLKRGAVVDPPDARGRTPLQWAAAPKTRKLLMDQGAVGAPAK
jgi:ankyrin repeat protein